MREQEPETIPQNAAERREWAEAELERLWAQETAVPGESDDVRIARILDRVRELQRAGTSRDLTFVAMRADEMLDASAEKRGIDRKEIVKLLARAEMRQDNFGWLLDEIQRGRRPEGAGASDQVDPAEVAFRELADRLAGEIAGYLEILESPPDVRWVLVSAGGRPVEH